MCVVNQVVIGINFVFVPIFVALGYLSVCSEIAFKSLSRCIKLNLLTNLVECTTYVKRQCLTAINNGNQFVSLKVKSSILRSISTSIL